MAQFKVEVGNGHSGDIYEVEAESSDAARRIAGDRLIEDGKSSDWEVEAVYRLEDGASNTQTANGPAVLPTDGPQDADPDAEVVDDGEG